jgi:uncharacterized protein YrrD
MKDLEGYTIGATDGIIGHVKDFYFDDEAWIVRYLVVETGNWLASKRVLISPSAINEPNWSERTFPAAITQEQVKNSPGIDTDKPISRQHEMGYLDYYRYPHYWAGGDFWGDGPSLLGLRSEPSSHTLRSDVEANTADEQHGDSHLSSGNEIATYDLLATDGEIGRVQGVLVDERTWAVRYLVVDTSTWWFGHQALIAPQWIRIVSWDEKQVSVSLTRDAVRTAPIYVPGSALERAEEERMYEHYGKPGYWAREVQMQNPEFRP